MRNDFLLSQGFTAVRHLQIHTDTQHSCHCGAGRVAAPGVVPIPTAGICWFQTARRFKLWEKRICWESPASSPNSKRGNESINSCSHSFEGANNHCIIVLHKPFGVKLDTLSQRRLTKHQTTMAFHCKRNNMLLSSVSLGREHSNLSMVSENAQCLRSPSRLRLKRSLERAMKKAMDDPTSTIKAKFQMVPVMYQYIGSIDIENHLENLPNGSFQPRNTNQWFGLPMMCPTEVVT